MTWTKNTTVTLPDTGGRTVEMENQGATVLVRYRVVDTTGVSHPCSFTLAEFFADNPGIDPVAFAANVAAVRAYGDGRCGFTNQ